MSDRRHSLKMYDYNANFKEYQTIIDRLCLKKDIEYCVYACLTFNPSGYIREAALNWLVKNQSTF